MFVVDTNILVYSVNLDSPHHLTCRTALENWRRRADSWFITWDICFEFLRVVTHRRVLRSPLSLDRAWSFLEALLATRSLGILCPTERHAAVFAALAEEMPHLSGNHMQDAATVTLMREHGIRSIYTCDSDFHRFSRIEAIDPVAAA